MSHENVLGLFVAFLVPSLAFLPKRALALGLIVALITIAATGSRTAALTAVVSVLIALALRYHEQRNTGLSTSNSNFLRLLAFVPAGAGIVAFLAFMLTPPAGLTERGAVWSLIREKLREAPLWGPGSGIFSSAYEGSQTTWLIPHAHNEVGHLLLTGGVLATMAFAVGICYLTVASLRCDGLTPVAFAVGPALAFGTEVVWGYGFLSSFMWTLFITVALVTPYNRSQRILAQETGTRFQ